MAHFTRQVRIDPSNFSTEEQKTQRKTVKIEMLSLVPFLGWVNRFLLIHVYIFDFYPFKCDLHQAIHYQAEKKK